MRENEAIDILDGYEACYILLKLIFSKTNMRDIDVMFTPGARQFIVYRYRYGSIPALIRKMNQSDIDFSSIFAKASAELFMLSREAQQ